MATTPNSTTFQPAFKRVAQQGRHDDTFAVLAMLTGKTMDAIFHQAEDLGLPKIGPFHAWIDGDMIAKLLAALPLEHHCRDKPSQVLPTLGS